MADKAAAATPRINDLLNISAFLLRIENTVVQSAECRSSTNNKFMVPIVGSRRPRKRSCYLTGSRHLRIRAWREGSEHEDTAHALAVLGQRQEQGFIVREAPIGRDVRCIVIVRAARRYDRIVATKRIV